MSNIYTKGKYWWCWGRDSEGDRWWESTRVKVEGKTAKALAAKVAKRVERRRLLRPEELAGVSLVEGLKVLHLHKLRKGSSDATMDIMRSKGRQLMTFFGPQFDVTKLTIEHTEAFMDRRLLDGVTPHTIEKEFRTLREMLFQLRKRGAWTGEPKDLRPDALVDVYNPRTRWLPVEEYTALLAKVTAYRADYITTYCYTGCRYSELYRIEAKHLDHERRRVFIDGTKNEGAKRWVPCADEVWEVLERRSQTRDGKLFDGTWYRGRMVSDLKKWCGQAGIEKVSANDFRRTFASWLCNAGAQELAVVRLMGHRTSKMVREVYAQLSDETLRAAIDRLPRVTDMSQQPKRLHVISST